MFGGLGITGQQGMHESREAFTISLGVKVNGPVRGGVVRPHLGGWQGPMAFAVGMLTTGDVKF
jgi:hypothetical protein